MFRLIRKNSMLAGIISGMLIALITGGVIAVDAAKTSAAPTTQSCFSTEKRYIREGESGDCVMQLQQTLAQKGYFTAKPTGYYGSITTQAVTAFQKGHGLMPVGYVGINTWESIQGSKAKPAATQTAATVKPAASAKPAAASTQPKLPASCMTNAKTICIVKAEGSRGTLYAVQNKQVLRSMPIRTGDGRGAEWATRDGIQRVEWKSPNHKSKEFDGAPMPYSLFFNDLGEAVHFSQLFANTLKNNPRGTGSSHGCVNVGSMTDAKWLYDWSPVGTRVVVTHG